MVNCNIKYFILLFNTFLYILFPCDMSAVIAKSGYVLPQILDNEQHPADNYMDITFDSPRDYYFDYLYYRSSSQVDGYGVIFYEDNNQLLNSNNIFYQVGYNQHCFNGHEDKMFEADSAISDILSNAKIAMGHVRSGTGGEGNHPFRFDWNGKTYTFMHNGSINNTWMERLHSDLGGADWFSSYPSNWITMPQTQDYLNFIDSELIFHWIMKHVIEVNGDVKQGIYNAFRAETDIANYIEMISTQGLIVNIILSDGEKLYVFRNSSLSGQSYNLSIKDHGNFISVKTRTSDDNSIQLQRYDLAVVSDEDIEVFPNFLDIVDVKAEIHDVHDRGFSIEFSPPMEKLIYDNFKLNYNHYILDIQSDTLGQHYNIVTSKFIFGVVYNLNIVKPGYEFDIVGEALYIEPIRVVARVFNVHENGFNINLDPPIPDLYVSDLVLSNEHKITNIQTNDSGRNYAVTTKTFDVGVHYELYINKQDYKFDITGDNIVVEEIPTFEQNSQVFCFPNPTENILNFTIETSDKGSGAGSCRIIVYNIKGEVVIKRDISFSKSSFTLNTETLQEGLYFLKLKLGDRTIKHKFIKQ